MRYKRYKRKKAESHKSSASRWMVTFTDLTMLILVFFVLMFAMSQIDLVKFKAIAESYANRQILDFYPSLVPGDKEGSGDEVLPDEGVIMSLEDLVEYIRKYLETKGLEDLIIANRTERGVVIVLQEQVLFETGEAEIKEEATDFLDSVGQALQNLPNMVKVEGHTDDRPISTYRYPSNWELSTARASSVIRYLTEKHGLDSKRFIAVGYGETRPVAPNTSPENWQKNRRVEIVIMDPAFTDEEILDS